ncbi:MAG: YfhO family protein [Rubrobacteraceae bacterium]
MVLSSRLRERFRLTHLNAATFKTLRLRCYRIVERHRDLLAVSLLVVLTLVAEWGLLIGKTTIGADAVTQYIPWYSFLGEQLRSGEVPGWNPYQLSGTPFAADPLSGWTYLPAMLLFTLLPLVAAVKAYLFVHPLLAGLGAFALARTLRMNVVGALVAAVAYEFVGYIYVRNVCCFAYVSVLAWLPFAILGAELAIRSGSWLHRGLWWAVSGLAISQILAAWLGQGSYYALLALGGYVAYRTLLFPPENIRGLWGRASGLVIHGSAVLLFGFGLAAAGLLPRLEYNALSNLADGYSENSNLAGSYPEIESGYGWSVADWEKLFVFPNFFYAGVATLALALAAPLVARGRHLVPYFVALVLLALTLSGPGFTLIHSLLYQLPSFESLQPHYPQRSLLVFYLGAALLAGATVSTLGARARETPSLVVLPVLAGIFLVTRSVLVPDDEEADEVAERPEGAGLWEEPLPFLVENGIALMPGSLLILCLVLALVAAYALLPDRFRILRGIAGVLLVLALFTDLYSAGKDTMGKDGRERTSDRIGKTNLSTYYDPTDVTRLLRPTGEEPFRYFAYSPGVMYQRNFMKPRVRALEAENRPTALRLQSIQVYHAVHLRRYDKYLEIMNDMTQNNYHTANVYTKGLDSPLLDMLNTRYIVTPNYLSGPDARSVQRLQNDHPKVYEDGQVTVLENEEALPRAWIVHSVRETKPKEALRLLDAGEADPRNVAFIEENPPRLGQPDNPSADRVSFASYEPDEIRLDVSTGAPGFLVMSEIYYPAWKAYVDGRPVSLYRTNSLFRGVPVPKGDHTVELRYESGTLNLGIAISLLTGLVCAALVATFARRHWRKGPDKAKSQPAVRR